MAKPRVLILGGCGFVGRNLVEYLVDNEFCSKIRVADKVPTQTAWLNEKHKECFEKVEFKSANLVNPANMDRVFDDADGGWDFVFNLAAETKYGQTDEVYHERVFMITQNAAQEAAKRGVKRFIEVSTAQVYNSDKDVSTESSKVSPWTAIAKFKLKAEEELAKTAGLNYVIVRPAVIYGVGDRLSLTPRLIIGAVYKQLQEVMKLLWTKDLRINTVHVTDVCRALWHLRDASESGQVFNLADKTDTSQGVVSELVSQIFGIKHDYVGSVMSNLAKVNMSSVVEDSNEKHMVPWADACQKDNIENTPLSPFLDQELLYNKHLHIDGSKIEGTGFSYEVPQITEGKLREVVDDYVKLRLFPASLVP
ncbi:aurachin B dehydrogenase-like [Sycon ciliatum]|uniref:aurachin B dehydrogenase-like n=1 Tax=Sycon ciliatum TaxID=27933 RepID=UPI0020A89473|eukprot:scpid66690/ scgid26763/ 